MNTWLALRGGIAGLIALITCPCHLPITLPLIIALTAGTAFGGWLAHNSIIIYSVSIILFIGGLALAAKWLVVDGSSPKIQGSPK